MENANANANALEKEENRNVNIGLQILKKCITGKRTTGLKIQIR